jgi:hypothetical protein
MTKTGLVFFVLSLVALFPALLGAQSGPGYDDEGRAIVAILPFIGDEEPAAVLDQAALDAVVRLGKYVPRVVTQATVEAAGVRVPTDMPPIRELVPGVRFALTGGVYPGAFPGDNYLQMWLWDMSSSSMIYTDDLVYEHIDEGLEALPGLVEWLFSHIVAVPVAEEAPPEPVRAEKRITLGLRSGVSQRWYTAGDESTPGAQALNFEGGLFVSVFLNSLLSLQAEADFTFDNLVYRGIDDTADPFLTVKQYTTYSLAFPLILKANFRPGNFRIAPFAGVYAFLPLAEAAFRKTPGDEEGSFSWSADLPLGYTAGVELGIRLGPGTLTGDIRWSGDFTTTSIQDPEEAAFKRGALSFTLGYGFGFIDMPKR